MTYIPRVTCEPCGQNMDCLKNSVTVRTTARGEPYYLVKADRWVCPKCKHEVLVGFAGGPLLVRHEPEFAAYPYDVTVELELPSEYVNAQIAERRAAR